MSNLDFRRQRSLDWMHTTFQGKNLDIEERVLRVLEEMNELAQAEGVTREQAHALVDQVFDKPVGEVRQEVGGVLVSLSLYFALKYKSPITPELLYLAEFERLESPAVIARVRHKHRNKLVVSSKTLGEHNGGSQKDIGLVGDAKGKPNAAPDEKCSPKTVREHFRGIPRLFFNTIPRKR